MMDSQTKRLVSPLEYARKPPTDARTCKLAIAAVVVSILASPLFLVPFSNWINWYVPQSFNQCGRYGYLHFYIRTGAMILSTALSVAALIQIQSSGGRLSGIGIAWSAFRISSLWWGLLVLVLVALSMMGPYQH